MASELSGSQREKISTESALLPTDTDSAFDDPGHEKLLMRPSFRFRGLPLPLTRLVARVVHFTMQRKQSFGLASRAEGHAAARPTDTVIPRHGSQDSTPERRAS